MSSPIHISSIVVTADPTKLQSVTDRISAIEFAEIAIADPSGKLVVTLETPDEHTLVQGLTDIQLLPGIASAALCFHHSDTASAIDQNT